MDATTDFYQEVIGILTLIILTNEIYIGLVDKIDIP
jgi:hypothetical protein